MSHTLAPWLAAAVATMAVQAASLSADSSLSYGNWAVDSGGGVTIDLLWLSDETIAGCQFDVHGGAVDLVDGGLLVDFDWEVYHVPDRVLAFAGFGGTPIPPSSKSATLTTIHLAPKGNLVEITDLVFADESGQEVIADGPGVLNICPADCAPAGGDGRIDVTDLLAVLSAWGATGGSCDVDGSGTVDVGDVLTIISAWGPCPASP